ncbi:AraC family transcriptional regulator [Marinomonas sp. S3726]|uniref:AraC family transcriptional regulator n=1 Tax=Marinomonas sp. S3726 TaxID=579484 RepID=UPI0005F9D9A3|nr:AraC family transcriptional regulator [Marinomonas sp. S3726]KJZ13890.1 AraC family transcriptional regulator [Marinomonas sp. S3726]
MFRNTISIRHYSPTLKQHSHGYHQLVFPLRGSLDINTNRHNGFVEIGQCLIIKVNEIHGFKAHENARFIVADLHHLPENLMQTSSAVFTISKPLSAFLNYVDLQLEHSVDAEIEKSSLSLFEQLLAQQVCFKNYDKRIEKAIQYINQDIALEHTLEHLSKLAHLSLTQFKKVFKENTNMTVQTYITGLRMEKAKSLLVHSDMPVQLVAEKVGYQNASAFSRKFKDYFGQTPSALSP